MRRFVVTGVLIGAAVLQQGAAAQDDKPGGKGTDTVTGCLTKLETGQYVILLENQSKMLVSGTADLAKHAGNHTVKLTGTRRGRVFEATAVEHVSDACRYGGSNDKPRPDIG